MVEGANDLAISDLNKALEINPKYECYNIRGMAYFDKKEFVLAISDFTKAIELSPKEGEYFYYRGWAYAKIHEYDKALDDMYRAQSLGYQGDPKFIETVRTVRELGKELGIQK